MFGTMKLFKIDNIILEKIYPIKYEEQVEKYSKEFGVDRLYVYAIIKAESNFNEEANSKSGAKGLMQLMDATAEDIAKELQMNTQENYDLYNPENNIRFGTKYFSNLLKLYNGNVRLALAAYNAGKGNVNKWIEKGIIKEDGSDIENIPFKETNIYVRKILQSYNIYQRLYD